MANIRLKWLSDKIKNFLKEEHTHAEYVDLLRKIQEECEVIDGIGDTPF